ncbi:MAG: hypothetical protein HKO94_06520, partial [Flavobacteriaceae bacterium]|nr:hypothetical protein [Flavobacteriaceae bacterium]
MLKLLFTSYMRLLCRAYKNKETWLLPKRHYHFRLIIVAVVLFTVGIPIEASNSNGDHHLEKILISNNNHFRFENNSVTQSDPEITIPDDYTVHCLDDVLPCEADDVVALGFCDGLKVTCFQSELYDGPCGGKLINTYIVTDSCGNKLSGIQTITVNDTIPPKIIAPKDITIQCLEDLQDCLTSEATATDNCSEVELSCIQGELKGDECKGIIIVTFTATDACGNTDSATQTITINDTTEPEIEDVEDFQLEDCNTSWPEYLTTTWTDNCAEGGSLNSNAGVDDGTNEDGCIQYRLYTFTITDSCGNSDTETTRVAREYDMTDPEIVAITDYQLKGCNAEWPEYLTTSWTDNCTEGGNLNSNAGVDDGTSEDGCIQYRLYTFTITDSCGNSETETTRVAREYDMTDPEIVDFDDFQLEGCNADWPEFLTTSWSDNCSDGGELESDNGIEDGTSEDGCIQYRLYTFTISDSCGNTDTETTRVARNYDMTDPEIVDFDDFQLEGCNADWPEFLTTSWSDNCSDGG